MNRILCLVWAVMLWRLSTLRGKKTVVLIWIFADWCPVCQREFRDLIRLEREFASADIQVITLECHDAFRCRKMVDGGNDDSMAPARAGAARPRRVAWFGFPGLA